MSAIYVREKNPPAGEPPLEWMLLTNLPIENFEQAYEKVQWYCLRWRIEMYHKVLKSGFRIEHCRLGEAQRLIRYVTVMSIIAWRILMLTLIARTYPEAPCTTLLTDHGMAGALLHGEEHYLSPRKNPLSARGGHVDRAARRVPGQKK